MSLVVVEFELVENDKVVQKINEINDDSPVTLNVGGDSFSTSLKTLRKYKGSLFERMFSGEVAIKTTKKGEVFIDRDGAHFRTILNFLRTGELILPEKKQDIQELLLELDFYQLGNAVKSYYSLDANLPKMRRIAQNPMLSLESFKVGVRLFDSVILPEDKPEYSIQLNNWLGEENQQWACAYRGSKDGFGAPQFHALCDYKRPSYTIIKVGDNIFGGYNPSAWTSSSQYESRAGGFLFTLVNPFNIPPTKLNNLGNVNTTYNNQSYGPTFGSHDIHISNNCSKDGNSFCDLPNNYEDTTGKAKTLFTGARSFNVSEIEVFFRV